ncbi:MAG: DNA recombination protein RmuC [Pseudomonadota bacterium]
MAAEFETVLFSLAGTPITLNMLFWATGLLFLALIFLMAITVISMRQKTGKIERRAEAEKAVLTDQVKTMAAAQTELTGRVQSMSEMMGHRQSELTRVMSERMERLGHRLGQSLAQQSHNTHETLTTLHERLVAIDTAQKNITELSQGVIELQNVLADKQTRGAYGQGRMEAIVQDALPRGAYSFQHTLSNGTRPDCLIFLPNDAPSLVIDAKFPLEAWTAMRKAHDEAAIAQAAKQFRGDIAKHVGDIVSKYFIPGETHETAFMFVPSESIFADLHERFEDVVQKAARQRVVIVSPSLLTLSIQVVQAVLRDARLREQAHLIQDEVGKLVDDIVRLDERVAKLSSHFGQAQRDIEQIQTSTGKIVKRGDRIGNLDVKPEQVAQVTKSPPAPPVPVRVVSDQTAPASAKTQKKPVQELTAKISDRFEDDRADATEVAPKLPLSKRKSG